MRYLIFYTPFNVLSTFHDASEKATLMDYISIPGVYAAGRLDYKSEGLLLLTDDGALIHRLTDPRYELPKTYLIQVEGSLSLEALEKFNKGIELRDAISRHKNQKILKLFKVIHTEIIDKPDLPDRPIRGYHPTTWLKIVLYEGKKHHIRRLSAGVGFPTLRLVRVSIGPLVLGSLQPGQMRELTQQEIEQLRS
jgi:pseudouridine synthase